jgi:hypothetical protein
VATPGCLKNRLRVSSLEADSCGDPNTYIIAQQKSYMRASRTVHAVPDLHITRKAAELSFEDRNRAARSAGIESRYRCVSVAAALPSRPPPRARPWLCGPHQWSRSRFYLILFERKVRSPSTIFS